MQQVNVIIGLIVLIILMGMVDVIRLMSKLSVAHQRDQRMQSETIVLNDNNASKLLLQRVNFKVWDKVQLFDSFVNYVELNNLILQAIFLMKNNNHEMIVHATLHGNFVHMLNLFSSMEKNCLPFALDSFDFISDKNAELTLSVNLKFLEVCDVNRKHIFQFSGRDPFVSKSNFSENTSEPSSFSINQLRFAGYLKLKDKIIAIVMLPNGSILEVRAGDMLGKENGVVTHVDREGIIIKHERESIKIASKRYVPWTSRGT
jgi:hypothetical protein